MPVNTQAKPEPGPNVARAVAAARDLIELTKPGITTLVVVTAAVGFYLASAGHLGWSLLLDTLVGTGLLAAGTNALNQYAERDVDGRMRRTATRPLPSGRMKASTAFVFAAGVSLAGALYLVLRVNVLAALLGAAALLIYVFAYTPLKRRSPWCTVVGAVPGAIPPLMGWAAVTGRLDIAAWVLFAIVFLWQMPHFFAIGWLYRQDYARAGFPILPVVDEDGTRTARQIVVYTAALLAVSLLTITLGLAFLGMGVALAAGRTGRRARRLFFASVLYLPALLALMVVDKV